MKQLLLICAVVVLVGCWKKEAPKGEIRVRVQRSTPYQELPKVTVGKLITNPIVEKAIRKSLKKPTGELTEADLTKVTELSLGNTQITDAGLKELAKLQNLTNTNLGYTQITDAGLKDIAKMQNLTDLSLSGTKITDACLRDIAKLQKLTYLSLRDTKITNENAAELRKALPKCIIRHSYKKD